MKVAIVGAGISGLYAAWKLAERGETVKVFEKREKLGKEACSGLFSERIFNFIPASEKLVKNQITGALIHFPKRTLKIKFSRKFFLIDHAKLDNLVADLAQKAGAEIIFSQTIKEIPTDFKKIIVCDGALSPIRRSLKLKEPQFYLGIQGFVARTDNSDFVETWPTKFGFLWKIPHGNEIEYGIMEKPRNAQKIFTEFLAKNNILLQRKNSAVIPQGLIISSHKNIIFVGDAAGLTKPWSGGGVIWSLTAANLLLKIFPNFLKYNNNLRKIFLPEIIFSKIAKKIVYFLGFNFPWILPGEYQIDGDFFLWKKYPNI